MEISYLGHSSFKIKGKSAVLITDPFSSSMVGLKFPKVEADIVTISHSHQDHNFIAGVSGSPFVVNEPGEYEVKGMSVFGFSSFHDDKSGAERGRNIIYVIDVDGIRICHLGDLGSVLNQRNLEELNGVDILMIPVGGTWTIGPKEASDVVGQIEPTVVLPMHFKVPQINEKNFGQLKSLEEFLSYMGTGIVEKLDKLSLTKDKLPAETKIVVLNVRS